MDFVAPSAGRLFQTPGANYTSDRFAMVYNVTDPSQVVALIQAGCEPIVNNPWNNFRNMIHGGDFSANPFQRNITALVLLAKIPYGRHIEVWV